MTIIEKGTCDVVFDHKGAMLTKVPPYLPATITACYGSGPAAY